VFERIVLPNRTLPLFGPFPHAIRAGDFLFVTGQLAQNLETGAVEPGPIEQQVRQVMDNLQLILAEAGTSFERAVMARAFITDFRDVDAFNRVYLSYFQDGQLPCRTTVGVVGLAGQGDVEIDLVVYCGDG